MKKLRYIIILMMSVTATSCKEDVLDKEPLSLISDAVVWNDPALIDAFLISAYIEMPAMVKDLRDAGSLITWNDIFIIDKLSDETADISWSTTGYKFGNVNINGINLLEWWEGAYIVIRNLNTFIERVPTSPVSDDFKKKRIAEARFLRAFNYFCMVKRYGGVPLITRAQQTTDSEEELYPNRNTEKDIYDFIISEMDQIVGDLQAVPDEYGRPGKDAAMALKSRAALYAGSIAQFGTVQLNGVLGIPASDAQGYYQKAYDAAKIIMTDGVHGLYNKFPNDKVKNFRQLFLDENGNPEAIWVRTFGPTQGETGGHGWSYDFFCAPYPGAWGGNANMNSPYLEMADEFENSDGTSGKLDRAAVQQGLWSYDELWGKKEPRFFASIYVQGSYWQGYQGFENLSWHKGIILPDGTLQTSGSYDGVSAAGNQINPFTDGTGFGVMKYLTEGLYTGGVRSITPTDFMVFRYGEILLNYAEAAFEIGNTNDALDAINQLRTRAGVALLTTIDREKIHHERKVELAFEGHRYWDARRWRTATDDFTAGPTTHFSGLTFNLDYTTGKYRVIVIDNIDGGVQIPKFYERNYYFPIGPGRTGNNKNLVENPGYQ